MMINCQRWKIAVEFSTISDIRPPELAFKKFAADLLTAFVTIQGLREVAAQAISQDVQREVNELLYKVVQTTADWYSATKNYSVECAHIRENALKNPGIITQDVKDKIVFEECWGPLVRELSVPVISLKGYIELIYPHSSENEGQKMLTSTFDNIVKRVIELLKQYWKHLDGEINLWEYETGFYSTSACKSVTQ